MQTSNANDLVNWEVYGVQDEVPFVTDLTVGYDFTDQYNLSVTVTNLFDSEYFLWNKAPGTAVFGMLSAKF
jgi:outer membrane receptor protein involved in Fe transport